MDPYAVIAEERQHERDDANADVEIAEREAYERWIRACFTPQEPEDWCDE